MAILATIQELKDKILLKIKGASTGSSQKTKAIDHREVLIDAVDTLVASIPVAINGIDGQDGADGINGIDGQDGADGINGIDGQNGADGQDGADGVGVPVGGTTGQALVKNSDTDYDYSWVTLASGGGADGLSAYEIWVNNGGVGNEAAFLASLEGVDGQGVPVGGTAGQVLSKVDGTNYNTAWVTPSAGGSNVKFAQISQTITGATGFLITHNLDLTRDNASSPFKMSVDVKRISTGGTVTGTLANVNNHTLENITKDSFFLRMQEFGGSTLPYIISITGQ